MGIGNYLAGLPTEVGSYMTRDNQQLPKNLAMLGKLFNQFSGDKNAQSFSNAVAEMAGGTEIKKEPAQPTSNQLTPGDTNGDGVVDYRDTTITIKTSEPRFVPTRVQQIKDEIAKETGTGRGVSMQNATGIGSLLANPTGSTGEQSGTPVAAIEPIPESISKVVSPVSRELVGGITPEQRRFQNLAGLVGFDKAMNVGTQDINDVNASANALEASIKAAQMPSTIAKNTAEANKINFEMSPEYIKRQGLIKYYEKIGENEASNELKESIIADASKIPIVEPLLKQYGNYGNLMRATGTTDIKSAVQAAITAENRLKGDLARASATVAGAGKVSAATIKGALLGLMAENAKRLKEMDKLELPLPEDDPNKVAQDTRFMLGTAKPATEEDIASRNELQAYHRSAMLKIGELGGIDVGGGVSTSAPAYAPKPPAKLPVPFKATHKLKGKEVMVYNGAVYDSKGNLIDVVK